MSLDIRLTKVPIKSTIICDCPKYYKEVLINALSAIYWEFDIMQVQEYWNEFESMYVICSMNPYVLAMKQLVQNGLFLSVKDTGLPDPAW